MMNLNESGIRLAGEEQVALWLAGNGYLDIEKVELQAKEFGLKAAGKVYNVLVQVRSFVQPNSIFKLNDFETDLLTRRAIRLNAVAYAAYVILDPDGKLAEEITWERLC